MSNAARKEQADLHNGQWLARPYVQKVRAKKPTGTTSTDLATWAMEADTATLWEAFLYQTKDRRCAALDELVEREDSAVVPVVITKLGRTDLDHPDPERDSLLRATPRIKVTDESLRRILSENLWDIAEKLKESRTDGDEDLLWTTIRRYATLRPEADIGKLVAFLGEPDEPLPRRHVVLLAIQNAFYASPPNELEMASLQKLGGRVSALAHKYLDRAFLITPDQRAIALSSYCAAAILGCADLVELTNQAISMREMWLLELAEQKLSSMVARWLVREGAAEREPIRDSLQDVTRQLLLAISSGTTV